MAKAPEPEPRDGATIATLCAAAIGAVFTIVAWTSFGARAAGSVGVGVVIAIANLLMLRAIIRSVLRPPEEESAPADPGEDPPPRPDHEDSKAEGRRGGAAWGVFAVLKILILFGGVWFLLTRKLVDPIPLVVGYGVLPLGITASALVDSLFPSRRRRSK